MSVSTNAYGGDAGDADAGRAVPLDLPEAEPAADGDGVGDGMGAGDPTDPDGIIPRLAAIQAATSTDLAFPRFIVIGNQSSGKTSALEGLIGVDILPKGSSMVTRRPLEVTLVRERAGTWVTFLDDGDKVFDMEDAKQRILDENLAVELSDEPLRIAVHAPHVHNVTLIDLPGYISAVRTGQSHSLPRAIEELCKPYVEDERNIILVVVSATDDLANSVGLREAQQADRAGVRSLGVVTKCDLPKWTEGLVQTLRNQNYPLGLGYVGVRCRTQAELEAGMGFDELLVREANFFGASGFNNVAGVRTGLPALREELSTVLLTKIADRFPEVIAKLDGVIEETQRNSGFLVTLANEKDLKTVAKELESLVKQLHPAAASRKEFEIRLRQRLHGLVARSFRAAHKGHFDDGRSSSRSGRRSGSRSGSHGDKAGAPQPHPPQQPQPLRTAPYDPKNVRDQARAMLRAVGFNEADRRSLDVDVDAIGAAAEEADADVADGDFRDLFIYGEAPLERTDDAVVERHRRSAVVDGAVAAYYKHTLPPDVRTARQGWHENLDAAVASMLSEQDVVDACFNVLNTELVKFAEEARVSRDASSRHGELARLFFRFLFERISARIRSDGLAETIRGMVDRERRPCADFADVQRWLAHKHGHPHNLRWLLGDLNMQLEVPLYSQPWTEAYFGVAAKRCSDDVFRILAVRLLEPLVFEVLSYSLNLFRSDTVAREAGKQTEKLAELMRHREVLVRAHERYRSEQSGAGTGAAQAATAGTN